MTKSRRKASAEPIFSDQIWDVVITFCRLRLENWNNLRLKLCLRERSLVAERYRTPVETAVQFRPFAHGSFGDI